MADPCSPIDAVTHRDPYPYYAELVERRPMYRDEALDCWVASSADAVTAVLESESCRVRPAAEPVPRPLVESAAGVIFGRLVRMTDGPGHCPLKHAVSTALSETDPARVRDASREAAGRLAEELEPAGHPGRVDEFAFRLPAYAVGGLLGVPVDLLDETTTLIGEFVRCIGPAARPEQIERGKIAAGSLVDLLDSLLDDSEIRASGTLLASLVSESKRFGVDARDVLVANAVGLLSQSYEATAGLVGNTLVALAGHPEARRDITADPTLLSHAVDEVSRFDAPVQNTRRFVARRAQVAGREMQEGDRVLVVLAAANRDPAAVFQPHRFDLTRADRRHFAFGAGPHECPGLVLAKAIAEAGVDRLLRSGVRLETFAAPRRYRPSANTRVPLFAEPREETAL